MRYNLPSLRKNSYGMAFSMLAILLVSFSVVPCSMAGMAVNHHHACYSHREQSSPHHNSGHNKATCKGCAVSAVPFIPAHNQGIPVRLSGTDHPPVIILLNIQQALRSRPHPLIRYGPGTYSPAHPTSNYRVLLI